MKRSRNETRFSSNPNNPGLKPQSGHLDHRLDSEVVSRFVVASFFLHARDGWIDLRRLVRFWTKIPNFLKSHLLCTYVVKRELISHFDVGGDA